MAIYTGIDTQELYGKRWSRQILQEGKWSFRFRYINLHVHLFIHLIYKLSVIRIKFRIIINAYFCVLMCCTIYYLQSLYSTHTQTSVNCILTTCDAGVTTTSGHRSLLSIHVPLSESYVSQTHSGVAAHATIQLALVNGWVPSARVINISRNSAWGILYASKCCNNKATPAISSNAIISVWWQKQLTHVYIHVTVNKWVIILHIVPLSVWNITIFKYTCIDTHSKICE